MGEAIRFSQKCEPPLKAGLYEIKVEQVSNLKCQLASEITSVTVATERFRLPPDQVYSVYPPIEAVGNYTACLPHIVLNRRTLPWEKQLLKSHENMPWLALLVFDETEGVDLVDTTCIEALKPQKGLFIPPIILEEYEKPNDPCTYADIPMPLFVEVFPEAAEVTLLSHGKGVSLDYKVTDPVVNDHWFATVVANRFCLEPQDQTHAIRHMACLVSLEGYENVLINQEARLAMKNKYERARMIVLSNWCFSTSKASFDFGSVFASLDAKMMSTPYEGTHETLKQLCRLGYFPMNHQIREGSQTVSWYQPPLIPYIEPKKKTVCHCFADSLTAYDPEIAMLDIRYSSAWQIGKSMALADLSYADNFYDWRQQNQHFLRSALYQGLLERHLTNERTPLASLEYMNTQSLGYGYLGNIQGKEAEVLSGKEKVLCHLNQCYKDVLSEVITSAFKK